MPKSKTDASPPTTVNCTVRKYLIAREIENLIDYAASTAAMGVETRP